MRTLGVLIALGLAWIGLLCVAAGTPAVADPVRIATPAASRAAADRSQLPANLPAPVLPAQRRNVDRGNADRLGESVAGIGSRLDSAIPQGAGWIPRGDAAGQPPRADRASIARRNLTWGARNILGANVIGSPPAEPWRCTRAIRIIA